MSLMRERKPVGLFSYFKEHAVHMENPYPGVYYVKDAVLFPTQIVVTRELSRPEHTWLTGLSDRLREQELMELLRRTRGLWNSYDKELASAVLDVSFRANQKVLKKLKGGDDKMMFEALRELMEPEINEIRESAVREGELRGERRGEQRGEQRGERHGRILERIEILRDVGYSNDEIKAVIMKKFNLDEAEAMAYL